MTFRMMAMSALGLGLWLTGCNAAIAVESAVPDHRAHGMESGAHHDQHHDHGDHHHGTMEIPSGQPVPSVDLVVHEDPVGGWNLELNVANFRFAPERVNQLSQTANEGHAHLYLNGEKITRLYSSWYHLPSLPPGTHEVTITLNGNGHEALVHEGMPIQAVEMIQVPAP